MAYDHKAIEKKWQHYWEEHKTFKTREDSDKKMHWTCFLIRLVKDFTSDTRRDIRQRILFRA